MSGINVRDYFNYGDAKKLNFYCRTTNTSYFGENDYIHEFEGRGIFINDVDGAILIGTTEELPPARYMFEILYSLR